MTSDAWDLLTRQQKHSIQSLVDRINEHRRNASQRQASPKAPSTTTTGAPVSARTGRAEAAHVYATTLLAEPMPEKSSLDKVFIAIQRDLAFTELRQRSRFVPGDGPWPSPAAMLIGEAPGAEEDKHRRPFVGKSGNFLASMMYEAKLSRDKVYITNVVKYRPPDNRTPSREEVEAAIPHLRSEVMAVLPEGGLIILLGSVALDVVEQKLRIGKVHGAPFERGPWTFVPMWHPSYVMQNRAPRDAYIADWKMIGEMLDARGRR